MHVVATWAIYAAAFYLASLLLPGFKVKGVSGAIVASALFGLLNFVLGTLLYLAIGVVTLGVGFVLGFLTRWIVTALMLKLADALTERLEIRSFGTAFIAGLVISLLGSVGEMLLGGRLQ